LMSSFCQKKYWKHRQQLERLIGAGEGMLQPIVVAAEELLGKRGHQWSVGKDHPCEVTTQIFSLAVLEILDGIPRGSAFQGHAAIKTLRASLASALSHVKGNSRPSRARSRSASGEVEASLVLATEVLSARSRPPTPLAADCASDVCVRASTAPGTKRRRSCSSVGKGSTAIFRELEKLLSKRRAMRRLQGDRPRTTDIGSWGIIQASRDLVKSRGCADDFKVSSFLASRSCSRSSAVSISHRDSDAEIDSQWEALKSAFGQPKSALLFHLKNHYALIFAWREWFDDAVVPCTASTEGQIVSISCPRWRRQILTARKRQKPSAWIDFEEVRDLILAWSGYQLFLLEKGKWHGAAAPTWPESDSDVDDDAFECTPRLTFAEAPYRH